MRTPDRLVTERAPGREGEIMTDRPMGVLTDSLRRHAQTLLESGRIVAAQYHTEAAARLEAQQQRIEELRQIAIAASVELSDTLADFHDDNPMPPQLATLRKVMDEADTILRRAFQ